MNLIQSIQIALRALAANKMRAGLTMLGMIIGVAAVITLLSVGNGATASISSRIEGMGTNLLFIYPGATQSGGVRTQAGSAATLTQADAEAIASEVAEVLYVAPQSSSMGQIVFGSQNTNSQITGVTEDYATVRGLEVTNGSFIEKQQVDSRSLVAVLGAETASTLFGEEDPVGKEIRINRISFRIVGVLGSKGSSATGRQDDAVYVPLTTLQYRLSRQVASRGISNSVSTVYVQVAKQDLMDAAKQDITTLLMDRHGVATADFTIQTQEDLTATATQVTGILTILLGSIAGISLLVGGIGIMNIMLVSVTERTREIGIRKAVGARRRDILSQFLIESLVVSIAGGIIGIGLGILLAAVVGNIQMSGSSIPSQVTVDSILLAVGVSLFVGVFFGLYPAARASALNPIEALRYE